MYPWWIVLVAFCRGEFDYSPHIYIYMQNEFANLVFPSCLKIFIPCKYIDCSRAFLDLIDDKVRPTQTLKLQDLFKHIFISRHVVANAKVI